MKFVFAISLLLFGCVIVNGSSADWDSAEFYRRVLRFSELVERNATIRAAWDRKVAQLADIELPPVNFTCDVTDFTSPERPTNVNQLRPGDITVIAAFGDSISAGNGLGARHPIEVALENRGEVWSIGGDRSLEEGIVTLPNILKKFNPALKGYSICVAPEFMQLYEREWFNVAKPGGKCNHLRAHADELIGRMKADSRVDYENDWKLVTMFVGGNDLCQSCDADYSTARWYFEWERTLLHLKENMPRTMINLVSMFDISPLQNMSKGIICDLLQWGFCDCARNWTTLPKLRALQMTYHEVFHSLANDSRFQSDDFTVIVQPQMRDMLPPRDPNTGEYIDILGPDCFHPTRISHQGFAVYLWNTMLIPVGHKPNDFDTSDFDVPISCPTKEHPFIFTNSNSQGVDWPEPEKIKK